MFKRGILLLLSVLSLFSIDNAYTFAQQTVKKQATHSRSNKKRTSTKKGTTTKTKKSASRKKSSGKKKKPLYRGQKKSSKKRAGKKGTYTKSTESNANEVAGEKIVSAPMQMIAQNKEKVRVSDSVNKSFIVNLNKTEEEGYFASPFSNQKKAASFQTMEGTAAVFKSVSGWQDKKFYILTNQLPVGTLVRITTSDLKSICAKVINALPEMGNAVQYRLNDAAAAILGITNKTFQISVTY